MKYYGNMGPFPATQLKGGADITGVPVFVDKLPITIGGIAGENVKFGRVVSIETTATGRRVFKMGTGTGRVIKGIAMLDPTIMRADPAQQKYYFAGRPMTAAMVGIIEIKEWDISKGSPAEGSTVWCRNSDGVLAFNNGTDISASGYTKLNAYVYESNDPNGAKVAFGLPCIQAVQTRETVGATATPVATPAAGAVAAGTEVTLSQAAGAPIYYTLDGTAPNELSKVYTAPIVVSAAVTIKAIALEPGKDPSAVGSFAYTLS